MGNIKLTAREVEKQQQNPSFCVAQGNETDEKHKLPFPLAAQRFSWRAHFRLAQHQAYHRLVSGAQYPVHTAYNPSSGSSSGHFLQWFNYNGSITHLQCIHTPVKLCEHNTHVVFRGDYSQLLVD